MLKESNGIKHFIQIICEWLGYKKISVVSCIGKSQDSHCEISLPAR